MNYQEWIDAGFRLVPLQKHSTKPKRGFNWQRDEIDADEATRWSGLGKNVGVALPADVVAVELANTRGMQWWHDLQLKHGSVHTAATKHPHGDNVHLMRLDRWTVERAQDDELRRGSWTVAPDVTWHYHDAKPIPLPGSMMPVGHGSAAEIVSMGCEPKLISGVPSWLLDLHSQKLIIERIELREEQGTPRAPRALTDSGNGERFADVGQDRFVWIDARKSWMAYDGKRWGEDNLGASLRMTKLVARHVRREADAAVDPDERKAILDWSRKSESAGKRRSMLMLAASEPGMSAVDDDFDQSAWHINCVNGVVDLRNRELLAHHPTKHGRFERMAGAPYDPTATCPTWLDFLDFTFSGDTEMLEWIQKAVGYCLTGSVREERFFFCFGDGGRGKSKFLGAVMSLLGTYSRQLPTSFFETSTGRDHPAEVAQLKGLRFAAGTETKPGSGFDEGRIKDLTGGDPINARWMRGNPFTFLPTHKLWLAGNHKPRVRDATNGIWRRMVLIPFDRDVPPERKDPNLSLKFAAELDGIFAWAVEGAAIWAESGLGTPGLVHRATLAYRDEEDVVARFLSDVYEPNEYDRVSARDFVRDFQEWCRDTAGIKPWATQQLNKALEERRSHVERRKSNGVWWYHGIRKERPTTPAPDYYG